MQINQLHEIIDSIDRTRWEVATSTWAVGQFEAARDLINSLEAARDALLELRDTREDYDAMLASGHEHTPSSWEKWASQNATAWGAVEILPTEFVDDGA